MYGTGLGLSWSTVEGGHLPESRGAMRGVVIRNTLYVVGGYTARPASILSWDPVKNVWLDAGDLAHARSDYGAAVVPSSFIKCY